jgi:transposase
VEQWTMIRYMRSQGRSIRQIAAEVGVHRKTVRRALASESRPKYKARLPRRNEELETLRPEIERMLFKDKLIGTRIRKELGGRYHGSAATLYRYLSSLRRERDSERSRAIERFVTAPAQQAQFDWSSYSVTIGGVLTQINVFDLILAHSRKRHFTVSLDHSQLSVFEALERSWQHFGGVTEELLVDRAREMVLDPTVTPVIWNPRFLELCGHYGIRPVACRGHRPATKGRVERPFFYLEQHFLKGRSWPDLLALERDLARFEAEWEQQPNKTTGEPPAARCERDERGLLKPLPSGPFISSEEEFRAVSRDCLVSYRSVRYSVPWPYAGKRVWLRPSQGMYLEVRNQAGTVLAVHRLSAKKHVTVLDPKHYEGLRRRAARTRILAEQQLLERFPDCQWLCEAIASVYREHPEVVLAGILGLADIYPAEAMRAAFRQARSCQTYSVAFLRGVLQTEPPQWAQPEAAPPAPLALPLDLSPDLSRYGRVLRGVERRWGQR